MLQPRRTFRSLLIELENGLRAGDIRLTSSPAIAEAFDSVSSTTNVGRRSTVLNSKLGLSLGDVPTSDQVGLAAELEQDLREAVCSPANAQVIAYRLETSSHSALQVTFHSVSAVFAVYDVIRAWVQKQPTAQVRVTTTSEDLVVSGAKWADQLPRLWDILANAIAESEKPSQSGDHSHLVR